MTTATGLSPASHYYEQPLIRGVPVGNADGSTFCLQCGEPAEAHRPKEPLTPPAPAVTDAQAQEIITGWLRLSVEMKSWRNHSKHTNLAGLWSADAVTGVGPFASEGTVGLRVAETVPRPGRYTVEAHLPGGSIWVAKASRGEAGSKRLWDTAQEALAAAEGLIYDRPEARDVVLALEYSPGIREPVAEIAHDGLCWRRQEPRR